MIEVDRPVRLDMHKRARLIKVGQRKGNAEFHGIERDPFLERRVISVPIRHGLFARVVVAIRQQFVRHFMQDKIGHGHVVGGRVVDRLFGRMFCAKSFAGRRLGIRSAVIIHAAHVGGISRRWLQAVGAARTRIAAVVALGSCTSDSTRAQGWAR